MRTGIGYDIHCLEEGRKFFLGGVEIPFEKGLAGHSDADVLLHAVCDALLGAGGLGDIGEYFPDTEPSFKGISSAKLLYHVKELLDRAGFYIVNIDSVVIAQRPKLELYKNKIRSSIASILYLNENQVNIKAKTNEGCDAPGRGQAVAAWATVLISRKENK